MWIPINCQITKLRFACSISKQKGVIKVILTQVDILATNNYTSLHERLYWKINGIVGTAEATGCNKRESIFQTITLKNILLFVNVIVINVNALTYTWLATLTLTWPPILCWGVYGVSYSCFSRPVYKSFI